VRHVVQAVERRDEVEARVLGQTVDARVVEADVRDARLAPVLSARARANCEIS
jgi:hypothetical protein